MDEKLTAMKTAMVTAFTALGAFLGWKGVMLIAWAAVMGLDYLSGSIAAAKAGQWSSAVAREGLWHKAGMIFAVAVAAIADWALVLIAQYIPLGIQWPGVLMPLVLAWYILTELGSILENAVKMGAKVPAWLVKILSTSAKMVESAGGVVTDRLDAESDAGVEMRAGGTENNEQDPPAVQGFLRE